MAAGVTQADANRTPVLDVAYGNQFKLNAVDIRTVAITHPKVFGTHNEVPSSGFTSCSVSGIGQTLDAGVRIKCITSGGVFVAVDGATLDGDGFRLDQGDEVFIETSQLSTVKVKAVSGSSEDITFIAT